MPRTPGIFFPWRLVVCKCTFAALVTSEFHFHNSIHNDNKITIQEWSKSLYIKEVSQDPIQFNMFLTPTQIFQRAWLEHHIPCCKIHYECAEFHYAWWNLSIICVAQVVCVPDFWSPHLPRKLLHMMPARTCKLPTNFYPVRDRVLGQQKPIGFGTIKENIQNHGTNLQKVLSQGLKGMSQNWGR
jgi:hypothetical protein